MGVGVPKKFQGISMKFQGHSRWPNGVLGSLWGLCTVSEDFKRVMRIKDYCRVFQEVSKGAKAFKMYFSGFKSDIGSFMDVP